MARDVGSQQVVACIAFCAVELIALQTIDAVRMAPSAKSRDELRVGVVRGGLAVGNTGLMLKVESINKHYTWII